MQNSVLFSPPPRSPAGCWGPPSGGILPLSNSTTRWGKSQPLGWSTRRRAAGHLGDQALLRTPAGVRRPDDVAQEELKGAPEVCHLQLPAAGALQPAQHGLPGFLHEDTARQPGHPQLPGQQPGRGLHVLRGEAMCIHRPLEVRLQHQTAVQHLPCCYPLHLVVGAAAPRARHTLKPRWRRTGRKKVRRR